jgi:AcrR family transcriptional regulator
MASPSPAPSRASRLNPADWIHAGFTRLAQEGIESVRVEVLARDLGVSKGSFYWHFRDRDELLMQMLERWEAHEVEWLAAEESGDSNRPNAAVRWARFVQRSIEPERIRREIAVRAWARKDERVALRLSDVERRRTRVISDVLSEVGFTGEAADSWSEIVLLVHLGWLDRAARDNNFRENGRGLGELLSDLILAASTRDSAKR